MGVVVPARDEQDHVERCLRRVVLALEHLPADVVPALCVVLDRCVDDTAARAVAALVRARTLGGRPPVSFLHNGDSRSVGALRDAGLRRALTVLAEHAGRPALSATWLLSTDADTQVGRGWALDHLRYAENGADAVAGMADLDDPASLGPNARRRYAGILAAGVHGDRHNHVYAANLGVRADAYLAVGGFPAVPSGEDHALCERLRAAGHHVVSPTDVRVRTSSRRHGRASGGLADLLRSLPTDGPLSMSPLHRQPRPAPTGTGA